MSLPYPEPGIRLIRQDKIDEFAAKMREFQEELAEAVENLDRHYSELKATARQRLGSLFNAGDYPESLAGHVLHRVRFPLAWNRRTILQQLNPQLYEQECRRVQSRFDEAVRLAEEAFTAELAKLVSPSDGAAFGPGGWQAEDFQGLGRGEPDRVLPAVPRAQRPQQRATRSARRPRPSGSSAASSRRTCATTPGCGSTSPRRCRRVQSVLDGLLVDRPRRNILRRPK